MKPIKGWRRLRNGEKIKRKDRYKWDNESQDAFAKPYKKSIGEKFFHKINNGWLGHFYRKTK